MNDLNITALGIMSGTSIDGLDLALCNFIHKNDTWKYEVLATQTIDYSEIIYHKLKISDHLSALDYFYLNNEFAEFVADNVNALIIKTKIRPDIIASHGHTVFHRPDKHLTVQLGNGAVIAAKTGISTICDFRTTDVALSGQGAPLVPIGDKLLFAQYDACLNLGGISNISYNIDDKRTAFDISPCNMALNHLAQKSGLAYDNEGLLARKGKLLPDLSAKMNHLTYYTEKPPKSLGREWFEAHFLPLLQESEENTNDLLFTVTDHIAQQIASSFHKNWQNVLVTGGGVKNCFLMEKITHYSQVPIIIPDKKTIDFKEAIIFAFLGVLRLCQEKNCLKEVTGATTDCCGGALYYIS